MPQSELQIKPLDIKRFILHRGPMIIVSGLFLFLLLAPLLLTRVSPNYRTETYLMLTPVKEPTLQGRERDAVPGDLRDYMRTLSNRITSYNVLLNALENLPKDEWPDFLKPQDPIAHNVFRLMSKLEAEEMAGTYLLSVSIEAGTPNGLGTMLNSITDSFLHQLEKEQEDQFARRLEYLSEERLRITSNVEEQRDILVKLAKNADQHTFLHKTYDAHLEQLKLLQETYWAAESVRVEKQRELDTVLLEKETLGTLSLSPEAKTRVDDNFGINRMEQWTYESLQELRSTIDGLTPENRERQYVEMRMDAMTRYLEEYRDNVYSNTLNTLNSQRQLNLDKKLYEAQAAAKAAEKASDFLLEQKEKAEQHASVTSYVIYRAQQLIFNIEQLQNRLAALDSRIDDTQLQAKAPLPMHVDRKAQTPEVPFESNQMKLLLFAFVLAYGFVGSTCLLFDLLDNRVRSRQDVTRLLGAPIPDPVPLIEESRNVDLFDALRIPELEAAADAYRKLAVRLYPEKLEDRAYIFCLTGTCPKVGTTTLALNLAESFAQLGSRVLLIELALNHPAYLWTVPDSMHHASGVTEVVSDELRGIDVIPAAAFPCNPLPASELRNRIDTLRADYDWILLDCGPLIHDTTAQLACQMSDAAILVSMEDLSLFSHLSAAKELTEQYKVPAMTMVLTGSHSAPGTWLFSAVRSSLNLITVAHRKLQVMQKRLLQFSSSDTES